MSSSANARSGCRSTAGRLQTTCSRKYSSGGRLISAEGRASLLYAYALGKAQRLIPASPRPRERRSLPGPIFTHGAVETMNRAYRASRDEATRDYSRRGGGSDRGLVDRADPRTPIAHGTPWSRRFGPASSAFASGWMRLRGTRRRRAIDRGFVLSDHVDWPGLLAAIDATGAETSS